MSEDLIYRVATDADIPGIQLVRNAVKENRLSDPALVPDADVSDYINRRGRGWVCLRENMVLGFSIVSVLDKNVWALFVHPDHDQKGLGKKLHDLMMDWYFEQTSDDIWLSTSPGTRAESFYRRAGWLENGTYGKGEIRFEMNAERWHHLRHNA